MNECAIPPVGIGLVKVLAYGSVDCFMVDGSKLQQALSAAAKEAPTLEDGIAHLASLGTKGLQSLRAAGCEVYYARHAPHEALYVPTGWLLAEHAPSEASSLFYGVRKSKLVSTPQAIASYEAARKLVEAGAAKKASPGAQKRADKMKEAHELLQRMAAHAKA
eukprot:14306186-Alexandrium_andersonii.AAC.1